MSVETLKKKIGAVQIENGKLQAIPREKRTKEIKTRLKELHAEHLKLLDEFYKGRETNPEIYKL